MKISFFTFLIFILSISQSMACVILRGEDVARKVIEKAYFIGLVKVKYYQEDEHGRFKEAGLIPFISYKSKEGVDLTEVIVVSRETHDSCDVSPKPDGIIEVLILEKPDGRLDMDRIALVNFEDSLDKLRSNALYVGAKK